MKIPEGSGKKVVPNSAAQLFFVLKSVVRSFFVPNSVGTTIILNLKFQSFSVPNSAGTHFLSLILSFSHFLSVILTEVMFFYFTY